MLTAKPVEIVLENEQKPKFLLIICPNMAQKLDLWGPFYRHI